MICLCLPIFNPQFPGKQSLAAVGGKIVFFKLALDPCYAGCAAPFKSLVDKFSLQMLLIANRDQSLRSKTETGGSFSDPIFVFRCRQRSTKGTGIPAPIMKGPCIIHHLSLTQKWQQGKDKSCRHVPFPTEDVHIGCVLLREEQLCVVRVCFFFWYVQMFLDFSYYFTFIDSGSQSNRVKSGGAL